MLASITPLGERARSRRWASTVSFYTAGAVVGGGSIGMLLGTVGRLVPAEFRLAGISLAAAVVVLLAVTTAYELDLMRFPLPSWKRQVNEDWLDGYRGWVVGVGFGFQLGLGFVTYILSFTIYAMYGLAILTFSPLLGLVIGATFGVARAMPLWLLAGATTLDRLGRAHRRMQAATGAMQRWVAATAAASGATVLAVALI